MELTEIYLAFRPNQGFALFLNWIRDNKSTTGQLLLYSTVILVALHAIACIDWGKDLGGLVEIGLLLGLLLLEKLGVEDVCLDVAGGVDGRGDAVRGRLEDKMGGFVGWLGLLGAYLSLVADHGFVSTVLIRYELPLVAWRSDHGVERLIALVLAGQTRDKSLLA